MDSVLQGIPNTCAYLDDILVTGKSEAEHLRTLDAVLQRLADAGVRLKRQKCEFMLPKIEYLGHLITADGLEPTAEKIRAIQDAPMPRDVQQLRAFLGLLNYYGKFLLNMPMQMYSAGCPCPKALHKYHCLAIPYVCWKIYRPFR